MPRLGTHDYFGGLFSVDEEARQVHIIVEPVHFLWRGSTRSSWLTQRLTRDDLQRFLPADEKSPGMFEFKGKTYACFGLTEDGFRDIRSLANPVAKPMVLPHEAV